MMWTTGHPRVWITAWFIRPPASLAEQLVYQDMASDLPLLMQLENLQLRQSLERAREHELRILLLKILEDKTFAEIAFELGISLKAAASVYYRAVERIKRELRGEEK